MYCSWVSLVIVTVKLIIVNGNVDNELIEVDMKNDTNLEIKWNKFDNILDNATYEITVNNEIFQTSDNFVIINITREEFCNIYRISVCVSQTCANTTYDALTAVSNISRITANNITTISWNPPGLGSKYMLRYEVELQYFKTKRIIDVNATEITKVKYTNLVPCEEYEMHVWFLVQPYVCKSNKTTFQFTIETQEPNQPAKPSLILGSSTTLTIKSEYSALNDRCPIEQIKFICNSSDSPLNHTNINKSYQTTFNNLTPKTLYSCAVVVMNEIGWSQKSISETFETDIPFDEIVKLTVEQVHPTSIRVKWLTTNTSLTVEKALISITTGNHNETNRWNEFHVQWNNSYETITLNTSDISYNIQMLVYLSPEIIEYTNTITILIISNNFLPIIGITLLVCFVIIAISLIIFVRTIYARKRHNDEAREQDHTNIEVKHFRTFYLRNDLRRMFDEFHTLKQMNVNEPTTTDGARNIEKNRVSIVLDGGRNYINASYIDGYKRKHKFIATPNPTNETIYDFWCMILDKKLIAIVMITHLLESSFYQYYPNLDQTNTFNDLTVTTVKDKPMDYFNKRKFIIKKGSKMHTVQQYHFMKWSVIGCHVNDMELIKFIQFIKMKKISKPLVVHCSNGVGRTGAYIALDILIECVKYEKYINVLETVRRLRMQRPKMVETVEQYIFLYSMIDYYLKTT